MLNNHVGTKSILMSHSMSHSMLHSVWNCYVKKMNLGHRVLGFCMAEWWSCQQDSCHKKYPEMSWVGDEHGTKKERN